MVSFRDRYFEMPLPILYLAGPLFNPSERALNLNIRAALQSWFWVHLPQIDGALLPDLIAMGVSPEDARRRVFREDMAAVRRSDALLIVLNGRSVDEGAAFELGVAWCLGKPASAIRMIFDSFCRTGTIR
jgi:nucleoside 2-deoxyribosyltransferase